MSVSGDVTPISFRNLQYDVNIFDKIIPCGMDRKSDMDDISFLIFLFNHFLNNLISSFIHP